MKIDVIAYGTLDQGPKQRLSILAWFLAEMAGQGRTVQLVHPSNDAALAIEAALAVPVLSTYEFNYANVSADIILVIDGDIIDSRAVKRLKQLGKEVYLMAPTGALPEIGLGSGLADVLNNAVLVPALAGDEEQPKTFACHHFAPTCSNCDSLVSIWKTRRREFTLNPPA